MVASPGHTELMLGKKNNLKRCGLIPRTAVLGSELYLTILHREYYRTLLPNYIIHSSGNLEFLLYSLVWDFFRPITYGILIQAQLHFIISYF